MPFFYILVPHRAHSGNSDPTVLLVSFRSCLDSFLGQLMALGPQFLGHIQQIRWRFPSVFDVEQVVTIYAAHRSILAVAIIRRFFYCF